MSPSSSSSSTSILPVLAASFAAGAAASYALQSLVQEHYRHPYNLPSPIRQSPYGPHAQLAVQLARNAGANMRSYYDLKGTKEQTDDQLRIHTKSRPNDLCTHIDIANEQLITEGIQQRFPDHVIIGEESVGSGSVPPLTNEPTWIIDPIDGTTVGVRQIGRRKKGLYSSAHTTLIFSIQQSFAAGLPTCCVSIGFCVNGKPIMGVVFAPMLDELYIAVRGYGAFRNGRQLYTSPREQTLKLADAIVGFELGYVSQDREIAAAVGTIESILRHGCRSTRQIGSCVLDLCNIASGRYNVFYCGVAGEGGSPWDLCAGYVIATEAGCVMESFYPPQEAPASTCSISNTEFDVYSRDEICASNPQLLEEIRAIVKQKALV